MAKITLTSPKPKIEPHDERSFLKSIPIEQNIKINIVTCNAAGIITYGNAIIIIPKGSPQTNKLMK